MSKSDGEFTSNLTGAERWPAGNSKTKIELLFGDRPQVLESIVKARTERKLSFRQIAEILSSGEEWVISYSAVKNYLNKVGVR